MFGRGRTAIPQRGDHRQERAMEKLDAARGNRCTPPGIKIVTVDMSGMTVGQPIELYKGGAYGFAVIAISSLSTYITNGYNYKIKMGRLRQKISAGAMSYSNDEEAITVTPGLVWIPAGDELAFDELWGVMSGSANAVVITIAIALKPGAMLGMLPAMLIAGPGGLPADVQNADADADFDLALRGLVTNSRIAGWDSAAGNWARVESRNADSSLDFAKAIVGLLANARMSVFHNGLGANDWVAWIGDAPVTISGEAHNGFVWGRVASALFARDTAPATPTINAVEARAATAGQAATLYRLLTDAALRFLGAATGTWDPPNGDPVSSVSGRANTMSALYTASILTKEDKVNSVFRTVETERVIEGSAVNPAAAVIATLDCRGLTHKSCSVTDTAVGTYTIEFSHDGTTYVAPTEFAGLATIVGTLIIPTRAIDAARGYRYLRIRATEAAGTVTVRIVACGA